MRGARSPIMQTLLFAILAYLVANNFSLFKVVALMFGSIVLYISAMSIPLLKYD